jgi:hypothetical protein
MVSRPPASRRLAIRRVPLDALHLDPANARLHGQAKARVATHAPHAATSARPRLDWPRGPWVGTSEIG